MPKDTRRRAGGHQQSVRLSSARRQQVHSFEEPTVEQVEDDGANVVSTAQEDVSEDPEAEEPAVHLKKKEKKALKHELFIQRLEATRSPYSKSHERRLKRKAKEQVGSGLKDIHAAISAVEEDIPVAVQNTIAEDAEDASSHEVPKRRKPKPGQIGEGKSATLTKNQRKRALQLERKRIPMILATPEFSKNPFQTIRTHAQNSLVKHQVPS